MAAQELFSTSLFNDASLQAYYRLDTVNDAKNSNNLTNNNTVSFNTGKFSNAADTGASNTNKSLSVSSALGLTTSSAATIMGWVNVTTAPTASNMHAFFYHIAGTTSNGYGRGIIYFNNGGTLTLRGNSYGAAPTYIDYVTTLTLGTWFHAAFTDTGTNTQLYLNGSSVAGPTARAASDVAWATTGFKCFQRDSDFYASGLTDDVAIFSRALSSTEISNYYNGLLASRFGGSLFFSQL